MKSGGNRNILRISILGMLLCTLAVALIIDRFVDQERARQRVITQIEEAGGMVHIDPDAGFHWFESENVVAVELQGQDEATDLSEEMSDLKQFKKLQKMTIRNANLQTDEGVVISAEQFVIGPFAPGWLDTQSP